MENSFELFTVSGFSFAYPNSSTAALHNIHLTVRKGEFLVLCGPSGSGKSTLLRQLKATLAPFGEKAGEILFCGRPLAEVDQREQSQRIGFVFQSPENQIVTDKVWHELAFGLESLGCETPTIRRRVAEMASFFGIEPWFTKNVSELSGGQKQLLNLASVMVLQPDVLILDEPTGQLDPIAASDFLNALGRINRELGTTVLLSEHRLEEALPLASTAAVLDHGTLLCIGTPGEIGAALRKSGHSMFLGMPTAMRVWAAAGSALPCPITVREGRQWLTAFSSEKALSPLPPEQTLCYPEEPVLEAEELWFCYEGASGYRKGRFPYAEAGTVYRTFGRKRRGENHYAEAAFRSAEAVSRHGKDGRRARRAAAGSANALCKKDCLGGSAELSARGRHSPNRGGAPGAPNRRSLQAGGSAGAPPL